MPLGTDSFIAWLETIVGRTLHRQKPGTKGTQKKNRNPQIKYGVPGNILPVFDIYCKTIYRREYGERRGKQQKGRNCEDGKLRNATSQPLNFITSSFSMRHLRLCGEPNYYKITKFRGCSEGFCQAKKSL